MYVTHNHIFFKRCLQKQLNSSSNCTWHISESRVNTIDVYLKQMCMFELLLLYLSYDVNVTKVFFFWFFFCIHRIFCRIEKPDLDSLSLINNDQKKLYFMIIWWNKIQLNLRGCSSKQPVLPLTISFWFTAMLYTYSFQHCWWWDISSLSFSWCCSKIYKFQMSYGHYVMTLFACFGFHRGPEVWLSHAKLTEPWLHLFTCLARQGTWVVVSSYVTFRTNCTAMFPLTV